MNTYVLIGILAALALTSAWYARTRARAHRREPAYDKITAHVLRDGREHRYEAKGRLPDALDQLAGEFAPGRGREGLARAMRGAWSNPHATAHLWDATLSAWIRLEGVPVARAGGPLAVLVDGSAKRDEGVVECGLIPDGLSRRWLDARETGLVVKWAPDGQAAQDELLRRLRWKRVRGVVVGPRGDARMLVNGKPAAFRWRAQATWSSWAAIAP